MSENAVLRAQLRHARRTAELTQVDLSDAIGKLQTFVSNVEHGVRRLDVVELWEVCQAMRLGLTAFVAEFPDGNRVISGPPSPRRPSPPDVLAGAAAPPMPASLHRDSVRYQVTFQS